MADKALNCTLVGDRETVARLGDLAAVVHKQVLKTVGDLTAELQTHIIGDKLSGQVLKVQTGDLRRSIQMDVTENGPTVKGAVYSAGDVKYAAIHEFGYAGPERVKTHVRDFVFGRKVAPFVVPQFTRNINMPERSFMRTGLADLTPVIKARLAKEPQAAAEAYWAESRK